MAIKIYTAKLKNIKLSEKVILPSDIMAFYGINTEYVFEKTEPSYVDPLNYDTYVNLYANSGQNFHYRLSNTGDATGGFINLENVSSIDLEYDVKRFDYDTNYRFWIMLGNLARIEWNRSGSPGTDLGDVSLVTLTGSSNTYNVLSNVSLYSVWTTFRMVIDNNGVSVFVNGVEEINVPSYTLDYVLSQGIDVTSMTAYVGSNRINMRNIKIEFD